VGGKGLFVKEIEEALLRKEADLAVHSMKDVPTNFRQTFTWRLSARERNPRDAFIAGSTARAKSFREFAPGVQR